MIIIGIGKRKDNVTFLLEANGDELANIFGENCYYGLERVLKISTPNQLVGRNIDVSNIYIDAKGTLGAYSELQNAIGKVKVEAQKLLALMKRPEEPFITTTEKK